MTDACSAENKSTNQVAKPIANKILSIEYFYLPVHTGEINVFYFITSSEFNEYQM